VRPHLISADTPTPLFTSHLISAFAFHFSTALGRALASDGRPLVYGGGSRGMMGIISGSVLQHGGAVTAVVPGAMLRAGGEGEGSATGATSPIELEEEGREKVSHVIRSFPPGYIL
jgi:predicted Rossmann-fold nucleotide-binding protein